MSSDDAPEKAPPAYIPFGTFINFIERLKNTAIPGQIDNSVMPNLAGGVRGSVRSALRFLGLTDTNDTVNTTFRELVQAHGTESWGEALGSVIDTAYAPVLNGLDLSGATPTQLNGKFRAAGSTGQMADKAIRFLLAALESAGRPFSPHLKVRSVTAVNKGPRRPFKAPPGGARESDDEAID